VLETPDGTLEREVTYYAADSPTETEKPLKGLESSRPFWKYFFPDVDGLDATAYHEQRRDWGERGVYGIWVPSPSINLFFDWVVDGLDE